MITIFDLHSDVYKILANPKRLEILHLIRDRELTVTDMADMLSLRQANLSQHLMILRDNHIVKTRKEGTKVYYSLSDIKLLQASDLIREFLRTTHKESKIEGIFDTSRLEDYLRQNKDPVCGMYVCAKDAAHHIHFQDQDFYFCASGCKKKFENNPNVYLMKGDKVG